ncbi:MAG: hypothetical protein WC974_09625 [Thermoplasmata archaeon]
MPIPVFKLQLTDLKDRVVSFYAGGAVEENIVDSFTIEIEKKVKYTITKKQREKAIREGVEVAMRKFKELSKQLNIPRPI